MLYQDLWPALQADILGVLQADDLIGARMGVLVEPGDVDSNINVKLAKAVGAGLDGKQGVGYLVLPIERADDDNANIPGGPLKLTITVQFCENVVVNNGLQGTGVPIRVYAAWAEKILKLYTPVFMAQSLVPAKPVITEFTEPTNKNLRIGQVEFYAMEADATPFQRLPRPAINETGSAYPYSVTISAPNAQAVYYTLDNSHPHAGNPQAILLTAAPIVVKAPAMLRVRAFAPGWVASDTAAMIFT